MTQVGGFLLSLANPRFFEVMCLDPAMVLQGEWWRLITCLAAVPATNPGAGILFYALFLYAFWLMGTLMESHWGPVWYNVYLWISYLSILVIAFVTGIPQYHVAAIMENTVLLAFGFVYADFTFMIYLIIPVKAKYIALLSWVFIALRTYSGDWTALGSVVNFFIFFGRQILFGAKYGRYKMASQAKTILSRNRNVHKCAVCGVTDQDDSQMEFRYCSKCSQERCYCMDHILNHEHV